jgi:hypothetical protein
LDLAIPGPCSGWKDRRQTRREIIVIGGPIRHDTLSKDPTAIQPTPGPKNLLTNQARQDTVVASGD